MHITLLHAIDIVVIRNEISQKRVIIMMSEENVKSESMLFNRTALYLICKRMIDVCVSLIVLTLLFPAFLLISYRIYKKEGKTILHRERRAGRNNRTFIMWKFRTNANQSRVIRTLPPRPVPKTWYKGVPNKFTLKTYGRSTLTETGVTLRKYNLHKIPQFIHVLKGDMSLVGPEPEIPEITKHYNNYQAKRQKMKPGMTGYAQVNKCSNLNHQQKIANDLYYINHYSFKLDLKIILRTLKFNVTLN